MLDPRRDFVTFGLRRWWRLTRGMTLGVRIVATRDDGAVCLIKHTYRRGWHLPGGGVERGETIYDAAANELRQETGCAAAATDFVLQSVHLHRQFAGDHVCVLTINAPSPSGRPDPREIADILWTQVDKLPDGATAATRTRLAEITSGETPSPYW